MPVQPVPLAFSVSSLVFMRFRQKSQPTQTTGLNKREIKLGWLRVSNPLTLLLDQQTQAKIDLAATKGDSGAVRRRQSSGRE